MKLKSLILLAFVAALSACSFDKSEGIDASGENQVREKLRKAYDSVAGTYQGTLQIAGGNVQVIKIRLYRLEKDDNSNSNGASRKIPVLVGNYTKVDPIGPGYEFDARYFEGKNELVMTNVATTLNNDDIHTVTGQIVNNHLVGKAITKGGYEGNIDLPLVTRESAGGGGTTEENEYYDNLRRQYQALAGTYEGSIFKADGSVSLNISIRLRVQNTTNPNNPKISIPTLVGKLHDKKENMGVDGEGNPTGMSDLQLTAVYNVDTAPRRLTLYGIPIFGGASNPFRASLEGVLLNQEFKGTYEEGPYSFTGPFVLKKTANSKEDPAPEN